VPGASKTVLEAVVPYSRMSMIQLLGKVLIIVCYFRIFNIGFLIQNYDVLNCCCRFRPSFVDDKPQRKWLCRLIIGRSSSLPQVKHYLNFDIGTRTSNVFQ
jgi:hypothetical protein